MPRALTGSVVSRPGGVASGRVVYGSPVSVSLRMW